MMKILSKNPLQNTTNLISLRRNRHYDDISEEYRSMDVLVADCREQIGGQSLELESLGGRRSVTAVWYSPSVTNSANDARRQL